MSDVIYDSESLSILKMFVLSVFYKCVFGNTISTPWTWNFYVEENLPFNSSQYVNKRILEVDVQNYNYPNLLKKLNIQWGISPKIALFYAQPCTRSPENEIEPAVLKSPNIVDGFVCEPYKSPLVPGCSVLKYDY